MAKQSPSAADGTDRTHAVLPWPDRLRASAEQLRSASLRIQATLADDERFGRLTDPSLPTEKATAAFAEFNALLEAALEALVDITGYDNPDQDYPDMTSWFEFRCPNVVYGRHTDTLPVTDLRGEGPSR